MKKGSRKNKNNIFNTSGKPNSNIKQQIRKAGRIKH
jgi:hypothetical protein